MLNCIARIDVLEKIKVATGQYFSSLAPDFNFSFKALATEKYVHYLDSTILISCGASRSNGGNLSRGILNADSKDFTSFVESNQLDFSPCPKVWMPTNVVAHEYELVRQELKTNWPQADFLLWRNLLVKRARGVYTPLGLAWREALIDIYGATQAEFDISSGNWISRIIGVAKTLVRPRLGFLRKWLVSGLYFKDENEAIEYIIKHPLPVSTTISLNKDF